MELHVYAWLLVFAQEPPQSNVRRTRLKRNSGITVALPENVCHQSCTTEDRMTFKKASLAAACNKFAAHRSLPPTLWPCQTAEVHGGCRPVGWPGAPDADPAPLHCGTFQPPGRIIQPGRSNG